jgi:hypothetical protein
MSYGFALARMPSGWAGLTERARAGAMRDLLEQMALRDQENPFDPSHEDSKQRLAAAMMARHPSLELHRLEDPSRSLELDEDSLWIQISVFDDGAGASFSYVGEPGACARALRVLWDCLEILESEGGYSTFDPQIDKVLDLNTDFDLVSRFACGASSPEPV